MQMQRAVSQTSTDTQRLINEKAHQSVTGEPSLLVSLGTARLVAAEQRGLVTFVRLLLAACAPLLTPLLAACAPLLTPLLAACASLLTPLASDRLGLSI